MAEIRLPAVPKIEEEDKKLPEKVIEKVVDGEIVVKKRSVGSKIRDILLADDVENVKDYAFSEVIVPGLKNLIVNSVAMLVLGEVYDDGPRRRRRSDRVSYATKFKYDDDDRGRRRRERDRDDEIDDISDFEDIVFKRISDAENVLDEMYDILKEYKYVSIKDYYSLAGRKTSVFDDSWGWTDLRGVRVKRIRGGYIITLSKPKSLD